MAASPLLVFEWTTIALVGGRHVAWCHRRVKVSAHPGVDGRGRRLVVVQVDNFVNILHS